MAPKLLDEDFIARLDRLELVSRKIISGKLKGERRSKRRGHSSEFADFRSYVEGDDLRFLDWNIYGRLDRLFLRIFLEEEDLWLSVLLDTSPSMAFGTPEKLTYAKKVAAALGYIGLVNQDRVRVGVFSSGLQPVFGPARGRRQTHRLLRAMEEIEVSETGGTDLAAACRGFVETGTRTGIVVLVTDFLDRSGFESALRYIVASGRSIEVFVFHVLSPEEIHPQLAGDLRLVDSEDGAQAELTISRPLLEAYERTLGRFRRDIQTFCTRRGIHYVFASTAVPFDRLVLNYLRRRGLVR